MRQLLAHETTQGTKHTTADVRTRDDDIRWTTEELRREHLDTVLDGVWSKTVDIVQTSCIAHNASVPTMHVTA